jgi:hypothetical protein
MLELQICFQQFNPALEDMKVKQLASSDVGD